MTFDKETLTNKIFLEQALSFNNRGLVATAAGDVKTGAFPQENGDVFLRLSFPKARAVIVRFSVSRKVTADVELTNRGDGIFEGTLPFDERLTGPANVTVTVDGAEVLSPELPVIWGGNKPANNVEIPDPDMDYLLIKDVPHGALTRELFWSNATHNWERCMIYTPPGYQKSTEDYPVLYLLHGGGDNEMMWEYVGRMSHILDNLLAAGEAVPFLVVMCNDMIRKDGFVGMPVDDTVERLLVEDCIPFVEANYRARTDKWDRAIGGLSMGSFMTSDIAFGHPELFGSLGNFTAGMTAGDLKMTYTRPWPDFMAKGAAHFASCFKLYFRSTTPQEDHLEYFEADDAICEKAGVSALPCYHRTLYPARTSKWNSWRMGLRDYAKLLFK